MPTGHLWGRRGGPEWLPGAGFGLFFSGFPTFGWPHRWKTAKIDPLEPTGPPKSPQSCPWGPQKVVWGGRWCSMGLQGGLGAGPREPLRKGPKALHERYTSVTSIFDFFRIECLSTNCRVKILAGLATLGLNEVICHHGFALSVFLRPKFPKKSFVTTFSTTFIRRCPPLSILCRRFAFGRILAQPGFWQNSRLATRALAHSRPTWQGGEHKSKRETTVKIVYLGGSRVPPAMPSH